MSEEPLGDELPVDTGIVTMKELSAACQQLKQGKACGTDGIPAEFWKAVVHTESPASRWVLDLCNSCMNQRDVPSTWHLARVAAIFKKGDPSEASNYRPISLLQIGYKLFAIILLNRLKLAGCENRIWPTQFGFRSGVGTSDALFVARRTLEEAWEQKEGKTVMLALDWARAFDSVSPAALALSLKRFGVPQRMIEIISSIYSDREFIVRDAGAESSRKRQQFGVSQGCPLSPFLFSIVMTTLMHDARAHMNAHGVTFSERTLCHELLYADDTLIMDTNIDVVHAFMSSIESAGATYGLALHWGKLELLPVRTSCRLCAPNGDEIKSKDSIKYLGALLSADGRVHSELARRIGAGAADFKALQKVWRHSTLSTSRKIELFNACIVSKTVYALHTAWLNKAERRRLDGFHARCLREILHIPCAYLSRVSNSVVFRKAGAEPMSTLVTEQQLLYFYRLANLPPTNAVRASVFEADSYNIRQPFGPRRVGRPRASWKECVHKVACEVAGSELELAQCLGSKFCSWRTAVRRHCRQASH